MTTQSETKQDKIVRRVRAMLATAGDPSATVHEAETAMAMATTLMDKYNLDRDDIAHIGDTAGIDFTNVEFCKNTVTLRSKRKARWQLRLAMFVQEFMETVNCYNTPSTAIMTFYGPRCDVMIACEIYRGLELTIYQQAILEYKAWARDSAACFCEGYVSGMAHKLREDRASNVQERGLILTDQNEQLSEAGRQWLKGEGTALTKASTSNRKRDWGANAKGFKRGQDQKVGHTHKVN